MGSLPLNHICFSSLCQVHEMMTCGWTSWTYQVSNHFYLTFNVSPKRVIPTSKDGLISFGYHYKRPDYPYMLFWDWKMSWFLNFLRQLLKQKCRFLAVVYKRTYDNVIYILHITELSLMTEIYTKPVQLFWILSIFKKHKIEILMNMWFTVFIYLVTSRKFLCKMWPWSSSLAKVDDPCFSLHKLSGSSPLANEDGFW